MQKQVILLSMIDLDGLDIAINDLAQLFPRWEDRVGDAKIWQFIRNLVHAYASEFAKFGLFGRCAQLACHWRLKCALLSLSDFWHLEFNKCQRSCTNEQINLCEHSTNQYDDSTNLITSILISIKGINVQYWKNDLLLMECVWRYKRLKFTCFV